MQSSSLFPSNILHSVFTECVRRWIFILAIVVVSTVIGYSFAITQPRKYLSVSSLILDQARASQFESFVKSGPVIDAALAAVPDVPGSTRTQKTNWILKGILVDSPTRGSTLYNLKVEGRDANEAKAILVAILGQTVELMKVRPIQKARLEEQLARTEAQLKTAEYLAERLQQEATSLFVPNAMSGEIATALARLIERRDSLTETAAGFRDKLQGDEQDIVLQSPTLPDQPLGRNVLKITSIAAALGLGFGVLICVVIVLYGPIKHWVATGKIQTQDQ